MEEIEDKVAEKFNSTRYRVERAMRHAITHTGRKVKLSHFLSECSLVWGDNYEVEQQKHVSLEIPFSDETEELKNGIDYQIALLSTVSADNVDEKYMELAYNMLKAVNKMMQ